MKKLMLLLILIPVLSFSQPVQKADTITILNTKISTLTDSIKKLNQLQSTAADFFNLYKYDKLEKYYKLCVKKPSNWKYYKGWSIRVFEKKFSTVETPEAAMQIGIYHLLLSRERFEKAVLLYEKRKSNVKADSVNRVNIKVAIHHIAEAYSELSANYENDF